MKERIHSIEYIRGISMLGVIGIHTGAYSLSNTDVNIHLFALLEIVSRFSVPIFFFVSAFGLFLHQDLNKPLNYTSFMKRRCLTVLLPYIVWSLLYMIHYSWTSGDYLIWQPPLVFHFFLFGLGSYQLYFLVILMWFYLLMPVWRWLVLIILQAPRLFLSTILVLQIACNYYSSYLLEANFDREWMNLALNHRMSYWVIHYVFIFLFGAVCAVRYKQLAAWLKRNTVPVNLFFLTALCGMLSLYYILIFASGYSPEAAVNTGHQLSPPGVLYTLAAALFFMRLFEHGLLPDYVTTVLSRLGDHSYAIYLVHPLVMYYVMNYISDHELILSDMLVIAFYLITVLISLAIAVLIRAISRPLPLLGLCLTGTKTR